LKVVIAAQALTDENKREGELKLKGFLGLRLMKGVER
jgi:hypothetical protein